MVWGTSSRTDWAGLGQRFHAFTTICSQIVWARSLLQGYWANILFRHSRPSNQIFLGSPMCEILWDDVVSGLFSGTTLQLEDGLRPHLCINEQKRLKPKYKQLSLIQSALEKPIPKGLVLTLGMKAWIADILFWYLMFHFVFVLWDARMTISDRLSSNFRVSRTNGRLYFSLFLFTFSDPCCIWPCKMWSWSKQPRLVKESAAWRRSSAGWMLAKTGKQSVKEGRRHLVTMYKASFKTPSMRREEWELQY